jgi:multimeric flavodoxin WrbA/putative sterol carrier protein
MKIFAINSSARTGDVSKTEIVLNWLVEGMQDAKADVEVVNIHRKKINYCKGCFVCWTKTPGKCVYKDDMSKELLSKYLECDLVIMATPLFHYTINAKLKTFIERTLPMAMPFFKLNERGVTTHPLRNEPPPVVVVSVAGFPEMSVFDQLSSYVNFLYKDKLVAEVYRTASEVLVGPMASKKFKAIREATIQGGRELVKSKGISPETLEAMTQELTNFDKMAPMGNLAWQTCIDEGVTMGQFQKRGMVPRPDSIDTFMQIMRLGFNAEKAVDESFTIQFKFSGKVAGDCHFRVMNNTIDFKAGAAENPGLIIKTPFDLWMDILTRKVDGQQMFMDHKYNIEGDFNLLLKMSDTFGR